jgi:heme/copper-type cytochrome/quinol oxidase subunit 2
MSLFDALGITVILHFWWPLIVAVPVLIYTFKMAGTAATRAGYECSETQKMRIRFVNRAFWVGIIIVILCFLVWYSPEIADAWEAAQKARK